MCLRTGAEKRARRPPGLDGPAGSAEIHPHEKNNIGRVFSAERPPAKIILAGGRWLSKFLTRIIFQRVCRFSDVRFGAAAESADSLAAPFPFGNWAVLSQSLVSFRMRPVQCSEPLVPRNESSPDKRLAAHPRSERKLRRGDGKDPLKRMPAEGFQLLAVRRGADTCHLGKQVGKIGGLFDPHRSGNLEDPVARILQEPFRYLDPAVVDS